jgi:hypothetical protein
MIVVIDSQEEKRNFDLKFRNPEIKIEVGGKLISTWCPPRWSLSFKKKYIRRNI